MKIIYCVGSLVSKGGMEKVLANKTNYFIEKFGCEIHIITQNQNNNKLPYKFNPNIIFHDVAIVNKKTIKGLTFIKNTFRLRKEYKKIFESINPDLVIVAERGYNDFVIPYIKDDIPKLREFHFSRKAVKIHASLMPIKKRLLHLFVYQLIFYSFNKYNELILLTDKDKKEGRYKTKTTVIPNLMDADIPEKKANLLSKNVISVGSMHDKRKNFDLQIKIWKKVIKKHPDWVLNIYGDGIERANLQKLIDQLNLNKNVILHGSTIAIEKAYLESSFFIFTSKAEGLPMVLIEAHSYGLPIISFDCPTGPSDVIDDSDTGFLVEMNDVLTFEKNIYTLIENVELRKKMGENAREKAKIYTPENISKKWKSLFEKYQKNE